MKRSLLLLLPVLAFAAAGPDSSGRKSKEERLGTIWQESLSAENSRDRKTAMAKAAEYAKAGGDAFMATMRAAWLSYQARDFDNASRHYMQAARIQGSALSPRLGLLTVAQDKGDATAAGKAGELVLKLEPTNYRALMAVAWGAFQDKNYGKAGGAYRRVSELYPEDMDAISGAAWSAFYQGRKMEAKAGFLRLMSLNPDYQYARQGMEAVSY